MKSTKEKILLHELFIESLRIKTGTLKFYREFLSACIEATIDCEVALENDNIREAFTKRDIEEVKRILKEEF
tara:strand:- start:922 stop:1137 length:216 start_codon:yes stop_codon:yes gene_type:complete